MHTSRIQDVYINNLSDSSIFLCGSVERIQSKFVGSRENYLFNIQEINSNNREALRLEIPLAAWPNQVNEDEVEILNDSKESTINMQYIKILSIGSGTTFQIGNGGSVHLESRTSEFKREIASNAEA
ncbi:spore germination protein GerPE [Paenibacillus sp.]|uniref:spore germination protein GerPE n=1 Tax=Paenibacillus sp. TaxID=58172 RepID=UPI0028AEDA8B|nr:spore germination protein GerPE [Paenibacillus sp.]